MTKHDGRISSADSFPYSRPDSEPRDPSGEYRRQTTNAVSWGHWNKKALPELDEPPIESKAEEGRARQTLSRPVKVNLPDAVPTRPPPEMKIKKQQQPSRLHTQSPWDAYNALRPLQRGGEVIAACSRTKLSKMVAIKKLCFDQYKEFRGYQYKNLLLIIDVYRFEGQSSLLPAIKFLLSSTSLLSLSR